MNVSEQLLKILIDAGGRNVYGVTGDALNFFVKAIEKSEEVNWRTFKHEGNASFAAFGESETVTANHQNYSRIRTPTVKSFV